MAGQLDTALKKIAKQVVSQLGNSLDSSIIYTRKGISSYNNKTGALIGTLHTQDGLAFALIKCGVANTYIFEEFNVNSLVV